jgi:hemoglobin
MEVEPDARRYGTELRPQSTQSKGFSMGNTHASRFVSTAAALAVASALFFACNDDSKSGTKAQDDSLYGKLGGAPAVASVIDTFLVNVLKDTVINARFNTLPASRVTALRQNLIDLVCNGTGGPCAYTGKSMPDAHAGMRISEAEFNALVGDLVASLDRHQVPAKEKNDLLAILGPMKDQIVGK